MNLRGNGAAVEIHDGEVISGDHRHLPAFQKNHPAGIFEDGGYVGGDEHFVIAKPEGDAAGVADAGADEAIRLISAHQDDGAGSLKMAERPTSGFVQRQPAGHVALGQLHDDLSVGV